MKRNVIKVGTRGAKMGLENLREAEEKSFFSPKSHIIKYNYNSEEIYYNF